MPREVIQHGQTEWEDLPDGWSRYETTGIVELSWDRSDTEPILRIRNESGERRILSSRDELGDTVAEVRLSRRDANTLIRALRRARDAAFGTDE